MPMGTECTLRCGAVGDEAVAADLATGPQHPEPSARKPQRGRLSS